MHILFGRSLRLMLLALLVVFLVLFFNMRFPLWRSQAATSSRPPSGYAAPKTAGVEKAVVLGKTTGENVSWVWKLIPE